MVGGSTPDLRLSDSGKLMRRHRQDRHAEETQHAHSLACPISSSLSMRMLARAQDPVGHPARARVALAGGVGRVADDRALVVDEVDALGLAVGVVAQEAVVRLVEEALEGLDLQFEQRALEDVAGAC